MPLKMEPLDTVDNHEPWDEMGWDAPWGYLAVEPGGPYHCPVASPRLAWSPLAWHWVGSWPSHCWVRAPALVLSSRFTLLCLWQSSTAFLSVRSRFVIRSTHTISTWVFFVLGVRILYLKSCLRAHARKKANSEFQLPGAGTGLEIGQCLRAKARDPRASSNGSQLRVS